MSTALDRRAEAAAAAIRAAVAHLEPPPGDVPAPPRRRWPALVAAVALVAAAIGAVIAVGRDGGNDVVAGPDADLPRLVVDDLPEGLEPAGAADLPGADASPETTFRLYGRGNDDDPFAEGDLAIIMMRDGGSFTVRGEPSEVRVRAVQGTAGDDPTYGRSLSWQEPGVGSVLVHSRSLSRAQLLDLAEGLRREGEDLVLERAPEDYQQIADLRGLPLMVTQVIGPGDPGSAVQYASVDQERSLTVTVVVDRPGALDAFRWLGGPEARRTTVRGHDGWLLPPADGGSPPMTALGWRERPGVLVSVSGISLDEDELRAAAESLRPATDEEWDELLAPFAGDDAGAEEHVEDMPTLAGAGPWRYARRTDDGVCFEVPDPPMTSRTCSGPGVLDQPQLYEGALEVDEGWWLHGRVPADVRRIALQRGDGDRLVVDTLPMSAGGLRAWAGLLPGVYPGTVTVVALAADGNELDRTTVDVQQGTTAEPSSSTTTTP